MKVLSLSCTRIFCGFCNCDQCLKRARLSWKYSPWKYNPNSEINPLIAVQRKRCWPLFRLSGNFPVHPDTLHIIWIFCIAKYPDILQPIMNLSQKLSGFAKTFRSALLTRWRGFCDSGALSLYCQLFLFSVQETRQILLSGYFPLGIIPHICHFFYTGKIFGE